MMNTHNDCPCGSPLPTGFLVCTSCWQASPPWLRAAIRRGKPNDTLRMNARDSLLKLARRRAAYRPQPETCHE